MYTARDLSQYVSNNCLYLSGLEISNIDLINLSFFLPNSSIDTICLSNFHLHQSDIASLVIYPELTRFIFKACSIHPMAIKLLVKSKFIESLSLESMHIESRSLDYLLNKKSESIKNLAIKNCSFNEAFIRKFLLHPESFESLQLDGCELIEKSFKNDYYCLLKQADSYLISSSKFGQFSLPSLDSYFSQEHDVRSIQFNDVVVDSSTIDFLLSLKHLNTIVFNHSKISDDKKLYPLKLMPGLKTLLVNGRNLLERADFKIIASSIFEKPMALPSFSFGLSPDGKKLTIGPDLLKKINFADINIFLFHHPEVQRLVLKDIAIAHWMAIILSFCKTCQQLEFINCKIKDEALVEVLEGLSDLRELHLNRTKFGVDFTRAIAASLKLEVLKLSHVQIELEMAKRFVLGEQFKKLQLTNCELDSLSFKSMIEKPKSLTEIEISNMSVDERVAKAMARKVGLKTVRLKQISISHDVLDLLVEDALYESLHLIGQRLEMNHAQAILKHSKLKYLDLSFSQISGVFLRRIARHPVLEEINLSHTYAHLQIKSLGFYLVASKVKSINLSACQLDDSFFVDLHHLLMGNRLKHIKSLNLSHNPISGAALLYLQSMIRPYKLDLSHTMLGRVDEFPKALFSRLSELNVSQSNINDDFLSSLSECQLLKKLDISGNSINGAGLVSLIQNNNSLVELKYDSAAYVGKLQQLIVKRLVLNYQVDVVNEARVLFNHLFEKLNDVSKCFGVLKQVYDDHILCLVEKNLVQYPMGTEKLNYVYGR